MFAKVRAKVDNNLREAVLRQTAHEGVVTLTGFAESFPERLAAEKAAKRVYGVKAVANDIKVRLPYECTDTEVMPEARVRGSATNEFVGKEQGGKS